MSTSNRITDIKFGWMSAEREAREKPMFLLDAFTRHDEFVEPLLNGSKFLVLGRKGAGKSAIAERIRLMSQDDPEMFTQRVYMSEFPFRELRQIVTGDVSTRYPTAWTWLLLILIYTSYS